MSHIPIPVQHQQKGTRLKIQISFMCHFVNSITIIIIILRRRIFATDFAGGVNKLQVVVWLVTGKHLCIYLFKLASCSWRSFRWWFRVGPIFILRSTFRPVYYGLTDFDTRIRTIEFITKLLLLAQHVFVNESKEWVVANIQLSKWYMCIVTPNHCFVNGTVNVNENAALVLLAKTAAMTQYCNVKLLN